MKFLRLKHLSQIAVWIGCALRGLTPWWREHPQWFLHGAGGDEAILNLGDPDARRFVTDFISERIRTWKIGCYRQDFNGEPPLPFWNAADVPDRVGMSEIRYVEGLYAFWYGLLKDGLEITLKARPGSALLTYRRIPQSVPE